MALFYDQMYNEFNDSIFNINSNKQIAQMQTQFRADQQERVNEVLRKDTELKQAIIERENWNSKVYGFW